MMISGRLQIHEALQPIVPVDDAAVEIVQVGGGEAAAVERHQGSQLGRNDRDDLQDHPVRLVARLQEGLHHLQPLDRLLALLDGGLPQHLGAQVSGERVQIQIAQELPDGLRPHADFEGIRPVLLVELAHAVDRHEVPLLDPIDARVENDVLLEVEDLLQIAQRHVQKLTDAAGQALEEPHVGDGRGQLDVSHALPAHPSPRDLHPALVAHHARELHALVLAARALVVLGGPEDAGAEQTVALWLERPVVDGLRLLHLAVRPVANLLGRGQFDTNRVKRDGLRMPIEDAPQVPGGLLFPDQAAEWPIRQHSHSPL